MKSLQTEHEFLRVVKETRPNDGPVYHVKLKGEGTLYSATTLDAAVRYLDLLIEPVDTGTLSETPS